MANEFQFDVSVDTKAALKSIESFTAATTKSISSIQSAFSALTAVALAAIAAVAGSAVVKGLGQATDAAKESEDAFTKLQVSLKLSGDFSQKASDDMVAYAKELEGATAISRNLILAQIAQAKAFGLNNEEAKRLVRVATDLSAVTGDSLESSVGKLTKSLGGQLGKLDDLGTSFKDLSKIQLLSGAAVDLVEKKFKGAAEALSGTFAGSTSQATNTFQSLLATIGKFITQNPQIISVIGSIGDQFSRLEAFLEDNKEAINNFISSAIKGFLSFLPTVVSVFRTIIGALEPFVKVFLTISAALNDAIGEFLKLQAVKVIVNNIFKLIVLMGDGIVLAATAVNSLIAEFLRIGFVKSIIDGVTKVVITLFGAVLKVIGGLAQIPGVGSALAAVGVDADSLTTSMAKLSDETFEAAQKFDTLDLAAGLEDGNKGLFALTEKMGELRNGIDVSPQLDKFGNFFKDFAAKELNAAQKTNSVFKSIDSTLSGLQSSLQGVSNDAEAAGTAGANAGNKIAASMENATDKGSKFTGVLRELVTKALEAFSQVINISVDVSKGERDLQEFKARIPTILGNFEAEGQKVIKGLEAKVSAQLDLVRLAADEEGKKKLENITVEQKKKLKGIEQSSALQLKRDIEAKERDFASGVITAEELDAARVQIQTASNIKMAQDTEDLNLETEQKIQDQKIQNAKDIEAAVAEKRKALELEISTARIKLEEDIAKKRFELQDELDKRVLEQAKKTEEAAARGAGQLIGAVTEYFVPGIGTAVGSIVTGLAQGGDFLAKGLNSIIDALPTIFQNFFKALPEIITTLVTRIPDIVFAFINAFVDNISPIISAFLNIMPKAAIALAQAMIKNAPSIVLGIVKGLVEGLINSFIELLNLIPFVDIPLVHLARGGEVPNGFNNDNFPASLNSGELVVDRSTTGDLKEFLSGQGQSSQGIDLDRLERIITRSSEKNVSVIIKVGERELADTILSLNRQGFRTA